MSDPDEYTVGWLCALSTEHVAAQLFLDEKYEALASNCVNDNNIYTLGKLRQ